MVYTPGPWFVLNENLITTTIGPGSLNHVVADVITNDDARLIREAPELLEACEFFVDVLDSLGDAGLLSRMDEIERDLERVIFMKEQARATIARAKGG